MLIINTKIEGVGEKTLQINENAGNIQSIEFLKESDDNNTIINSEQVQYINLPQDEIFVDEIFVDGNLMENKSQLGRYPRIKVVFDKPGKYKFKIKLIPGAENVVYTETEKSRNSNFTHSEEELELETNSDGEQILDANQIKLSAAGNDSFTIEAKDNKNNTVNSTGNILNKRIVFILPCIMNGIEADQDITITTNEYQNHGIELKEINSESIAYKTVITKNGTLNNVKSEIQGKLNNLEPQIKNNSIAVAFVDQIAVKIRCERPFRGSVPNSPSITTINLRENSTKYPLWYNLDDEDWFLDCVLKYDDGRIKSIPKRYCLPTTNNNNNTGLCTKVLIDLFTFYADNPDITCESGKIELNVNVIKNMIGGKKLANSKIVLISTRAYWKDHEETKKNHIVMHELGHILGLVSDGSGKKPDACITHYVGKGHKGNHCHAGLPANRTEYVTSDTANCQCVMFGTVNHNMAFCDNCAITLKKVEI